SSCIPSGEQRWVARYLRPDGNGSPPTGIAVSPDSSTVFVTGSDRVTTTSASDYTTIAYNGTTGAQRWVARYNGPGKQDDGAEDIAVSPDGTQVFVTGRSDGGSTTRADFATIAYSATNGSQLWVARYNGPNNGSDGARS